MQSSHTSPAHTPAPWNVYTRGGKTFVAAENREPIGEHTSPYSRVCDIPHMADRTIPPCRLANARLIAAAPDLLSACYTALEEIEQWDEVMGGSEDPRTHEAMQELREAVAKAEGRA